MTNHHLPLWTPSGPPLDPLRDGGLVRLTTAIEPREVSVSTSGGFRRLPVPFTAHSHDSRPSTLSIPLANSDH
eukprot:9500492-Pyramimonas_sp.AAC.3